MIKPGVIYALLFSTACCFAAPTDTEAIRTIIGEAANQGPVGMEAVGRVIRNRGCLQGFCGRNAKHIDKQPAWVWRQAAAAWRRSAGRDITWGSTHFENVGGFGPPPWAWQMVKTVRIRDHQFYKLPT